MSQVMKPADIARLRQVGNPRVSPDGAAVAFTVADPDLEANRYTRRIWLAPADAGDGRPRPFTGQGSEVLPRWSPDGHRLAFAVVGGDGRSQICVLPATERGGRLGLCSAPPARARYGAGGEHPRDEATRPRRIARLLYRYNGAGWTADRPSRVFVVVADGSAQPRPLTPGPFEASGLAWSADSRSLAFASGRHQDWDLDLAVDLWVVPADGSGEPERVASGGAAYSLPSWSPGGDRLGCYVNP